MIFFQKQTDMPCSHPIELLYALAMQDIIDPSRTDAVSDKGIPVKHWVPALVNPRASPPGVFVSEISGIPADKPQFVPATDSGSVPIARANRNKGRASFSVV